MIGSWDLQIAVVDLLKGGGVADQRVYDATAVPVGVTFPYVGVGDTQALGADVQGRSGTDESLSLQFWDRANAGGGQRGTKNIKLLADQAHDILNGKNIDVSGRSAAFAVIGDFRTIGDPDPLTAHGVMTLRVQHFGPQET